MPWVTIKGQNQGHKCDWSFQLKPNAYLRHFRASTGRHNRSTCTPSPPTWVKEVVIHWSWENNKKLRPGQAARSRTLRATRGPPPSGSLIINETWGWDRRPWLNTKRAGAAREQGWAVRGETGGGSLIEQKALNPAPATVCAFTVCSKGSRHNNLHSRATLENQRGELEGQIVVRTVRGDGSREREEGGEGEKKKKNRKRGCPVGGRKKATRGMKNSVHVSSLFPMKSCRPRTSTRQSVHSPWRCYHAETSITSAAWWKSG